MPLAVEFGGDMQTDVIGQEHSTGIFSESDYLPQAIQYTHASCSSRVNPIYVYQLPLAQAYAIFLCNGD